MTGTACGGLEGRLARIDLDRCGYDTACLPQEVLITPEHH